MSTSFGALCTDFYVNMKLALKMDLPGDRETILHLFDRVKKAYPSMDRFHRHDGELTLESTRREYEYRWMGLRRTSLRTAHVNPRDLADAYKFHRLVLEESPFHLSISSLDVDYLELLLGFDLECKTDQDLIVYDALFAGTPLADLLKPVGDHDARVVDVQPVFGMSLSEKGDVQARFEVKTRTRGKRSMPSRYPDEPLSLYVTCLRYGPIAKLDDLGKWFDQLRGHAETLANERLVPDLLTPIARQINASA